MKELALFGLPLLCGTAFAAPGISEFAQDGVIVDMTTDVDRGGLVKRGVEYDYPSDALSQGISGSVHLRVLVDEKGKIASRLDDRCERFMALKPGERMEQSVRWHPRLCIEVESGATELGWPATMDAGRTQFRPLVGDDGREPYFVTWKVDYKLD